MNIIVVVWHEALFRPLFNILVWITDVLPTHNVGLAMIAVTVLTRIIILPSAYHQAKQLQHNQKKMSAIKHKLAEINEKHKDDKTKRSEATMAVYKEAGINPAGGCLPLLIQLPILIALYRVFYAGLTPASFSNLYSFVAAPLVIRQILFGISLTKPSLVLGILAGIGQFAQMRFFTPTPTSQPGMNQDSEQMMASMQQSMMYVFPVMTVMIALRLPAALSLYWVVSTLLMIVQQVMIKRLLHLPVNTPSI